MAHANTQKSCPQCGATIRPDARFCNKCGAKLEEPSALAPAVTQTRYQCNSCGALQEDGAWEDAMNARAKVTGQKGFYNIGGSPECLKCGSTDLLDRYSPPAGDLEKEKRDVKLMPERIRLLELVKKYESIERLVQENIQRYGYTRETFFKNEKVREEEPRIKAEIKALGEKLAKDGGRDLMYQVGTSLEMKVWQSFVSSCWNGISYDGGTWMD